MINKIKICTIVGARPQFIKAAPVSNAFKKSMLIDEVIIHTGQHYDANMSDIFFGELQMLPPKYNLNVGSGSHAQQTAKIMISLEEVLQKELPNGVLIYGDTNSTLAGAIVASKLHIPLIHVEAGLRSHNMSMPEEVNRIMSDSVSQLLLAPTEQSKATLISEGKNEKNIIITGDVMYDIALQTSKKIQSADVTMKYGIKENGYYLVTIHRAENTESKSRLQQLIELLENLSRNSVVLFPIHPRTLHSIQRFGLLDRLYASKDIRVIDPVGYMEMTALQKYCKCIVSDSGGVQKEAFFHGKSCFIVRDETEWTELVDAGWNVLLTSSLFGKAYDIITNYSESFRKNISPYGNGDAAGVISSAIVDYYRSRIEL